MRPPAEVDKIAIPVSGYSFPFKIREQLQFVTFIQLFKKLLRLLAGNFFPFKWEVLINNILHFFFDPDEYLGGECFF